MGDNVKRILITGGSGFIGRNLRYHLKNRYEILSPRHSELDLLNGKAVEDWLKNNKVDIVIHCAVQKTLGLPESYAQMVLKNNLQMFFHLQRCNQYYEKMFYLGSGAEYGKKAYIPKIEEKDFDRVVPEDDYGLSKYIMAKSIAENENIYDLRLFGVYGPYENYNYRFISNTICKALKGYPVKIHQNVNFDYLYITDFCNIMEWFLENEPRYRHYNVCTGRVYDIKTIAEIVVEECKSTSVISIENPGMSLEYSGSNQRLMHELGSYDFVSVRRAVQEMIYYYKKNEYILSGDY